VLPELAEEVYSGLLCSSEEGHGDALSVKFLFEAGWEEIQCLCACV